LEKMLLGRDISHHHYTPVIYAMEINFKNRKKEE
jgi:hypothetical protein